MKIAVIGTSGLLGQHVVLEAERAGINVLSVTDTPTNMVGNGIVLLKRFDELQASDLAKCHAVIDLLSFDYDLRRNASILPFTYLQRIIARHTRLIARGQCMFLFTDCRRRERVYAAQRAEQLSADGSEELYRSFISIDFKQHDNWNILCPPLILDEQAAQDASWDITLGDDILPVSITGSSYINLADYARGFVELLKRTDLRNCCCSVFACR